MASEGLEAMTHADSGDVVATHISGQLWARKVGLHDTEINIGAFAERIISQEGIVPLIAVKLLTVTRLAITVIVVTYRQVDRRCYVVVTPKPINILVSASTYITYATNGIPIVCTDSASSIYI